MITNFDKIRVNEIITSKPFFFYEDKLKVNIANSLYDEFFFIDTPMFTNKYDFSKYLKLYIDPPLGKIKTFVEFINDYEEEIFKIIRKDFRNFEQRSVLEKEGDKDYPLQFINLRLPLRNTTPQYMVFDIDGTITSLENLKVGTQFKCVLDISEVWIDLGTKKFGLNIKLLQLKMYNPIYFTNSFMLDNLKKHEMIIPKKSEKNEEKQQPVKFVPNLTDIMKMKKNLKKSDET